MKPHDWTAEDVEINTAIAELTNGVGGPAGVADSFMLFLAGRLRPYRVKISRGWVWASSPIWQPSESASIHMVSPVQSWAALRLLVSFFNWHVTLYSVLNVQHNGSVFVYIAKGSPQIVTVFSCDENFKIYFRNFQMYNILLLTILTMLLDYIPMTYLAYNWRLCSVITCTHFTLQSLPL